MSKQINNLGTEILYEAPGAFALLFAGAGFYLSEGDPAVRDQLTNTKQKLTHWSKMYNWGFKFMPILVLGGSASAFAAYFKTKQTAWLVGGSVFLSIIPYTFAIMMKTNNQLETILKNTSEPEVEEQKKQTVVDLMKKWVKLHRGRALTALAAAGIFFIAKQYTKSSV